MTAISNALSTTAQSMNNSAGRLIKQVATSTAADHKLTPGELLTSANEINNNKNLIRAELAAWQVLLDVRGDAVNDFVKSLTGVRPKQDAPKPEKKQPFYIV